MLLQSCELTVSAEWVNMKRLNPAFGILSGKITISKFVAIILYGMSLPWMLTAHYCYLHAEINLRPSSGNSVLKLLYIRGMVIEERLCICFALSTSASCEDSVWDVWARTHSDILIVYKGHNSSMVQCLHDRFGFLWIWELVLLRINRVSSLLNFAVYRMFNP